MLCRAAVASACAVRDTRASCQTRTSSGSDAHDRSASDVHALQKITPRSSRLLSLSPSLASGNCKRATLPVCAHWSTSANISELSANISQYQPISANISQLSARISQLSAIIRQYQRIISQYQPISAKYQPLSATYQQISANVSQYQPLSANISQYQPIISQYQRLISADND